MEIERKFLIEKENLPENLASYPCHRIDSVGHKPIRLIRTKPVTILLLAFRIRKVIERQRKVTIRMIQPDKRRIENTL